jgi:hypothetical protein
MPLAACARQPSTDLLPDFADGEALTLTDVQTLLVAARQSAGAPPPPDNKRVLTRGGSTRLTASGCTSGRWSM